MRKQDVCIITKAAVLDSLENGDTQALMVLYGMLSENARRTFRQQVRACANCYPEYKVLQGLKFKGTA
jgi:hypothetical protein